MRKTSWRNVESKKVHVVGRRDDSSRGDHGDGYEQTDLQRAMAKPVRNALLDNKADSFLEIHAGRLLFDAQVCADRLSDESTRKILSSRKAERCLLNFGRAVESLVINPLNTTVDTHWGGHCFWIFFCGGTW